MDDNFNHLCPGCGVAIDRALELPGAVHDCACAVRLWFGPRGWLRVLGDPETIERALTVRAAQMLSFAESTLDLVLSAPPAAFARVPPETARALLAFVEGTLTSLPDDSADGRRLLIVRGALLDATEGMCANTTA